jgi:hypothetical protein
MPEANSKLDRLLAQGTDRAFHVLGDFDYWCFCL